MESTDLELHQLMLWEKDRITVECRWSDVVGWEWSLKHYDLKAGWSLLDAGTAKSPQSAFIQAAEALRELAHIWEF